jgi:hypothetical protein
MANRVKTWAEEEISATIAILEGEEIQIGIGNIGVGKSWRTVTICLVHQNMENYRLNGPS